MIKVCHLTSVHPPKDGRIFYKECTSLAKAGYDVTLVVAGAEDEVCNEVKIVGVKKASSRFGRIFHTTNNVYKKALEIDANIYHLHDPELLPIGLKLKKKGKIVIFDSHEFVGYQILSKNYIPRVLRKLISNFYKWVESYICKRLDAVIEICTIDGKDYFEGRSKRRIFVTNAPIVNSKFLKNPTKDLNLKKIVQIGALTSDRGITNLAKAIVKTECELVLAGNFSSSEYEGEIKAICGDKLEYKGMLPTSEIQPLLSDCGIGTGTFLDKGQYYHCDILATKYYDYMLAGIPIIMCDTNYNTRFNKKYNIGICTNTQEPEAIANAIKYLNAHPEEAHKKGLNGQKLVLEELNWNNEEKKLFELYFSLINEHIDNKSLRRQS